METLFRCIERAAAEYTKLNYLRKNIAPRYDIQLTLILIQSVSQFKRLDSAQCNTNKYHLSSSTFSLDPDLVFVSYASVLSNLRLSCSRDT